LKKYILLLICVLTLLLSGCWSSKEPKDLTYANSSFYDVEPDGTYVSITEFINPHGLGGAGIFGGAGADKNPYITVRGTGESIRESIVDEAKVREVPGFGTHNKVRLLSERFARMPGNVAALLDMAGREQQLDEKPLLAVIRGDQPEKVYECTLGTSSLVGDYLYKQAKDQPKDIPMGVFVSTLEFIRDYFTEGKEPVMGLINIIETDEIVSGNNKAAQIGTSESGPKLHYAIDYEGVAVFKDTVLVGFLDGEGAEAYNFIENKIESAYISVKAGDRDIGVIHIAKPKADIKVSVSGGKAVVDINIKAAGTIVTVNGAVDVTKPEGIKAFQDGLSSKVQELILTQVKKVQAEFISDIFGFGQYLHIQHHKDWNEVKDDWNDVYFASAEVNVKVKCDIAQTGHLEKPIVMEGS
jgi:spore germination protein KC